MDEQAQEQIISELLYEYRSYIDNAIEDLIIFGECSIHITNKQQNE